MTTPPPESPQPPEGTPPSPWAGGAPPPSPWPQGVAPLPQQQTLPPRQSKTPIVLGALIGLVGVLLGGAIGIFGDQALRDAGWSGGLLMSPLWVVPLVGFILIFPERTRRWGAGILLGVALSFVVGFAACVGIFFTYATSSNA